MVMYRLICAVLLMSVFQLSVSEETPTYGFVRDGTLHCKRSVERNKWYRFLADFIGTLTSNCIERFECGEANPTWLIAETFFVDDEGVPKQQICVTDSSRMMCVENSTKPCNEIVDEMVRNLTLLSTNGTGYTLQRDRRCPCDRSAKDCSDLYTRGVRQSGVYTVKPKRGNEIKVYCDMVTDGGGWTMFQRRLDGSVDFYLGWNDYKNGFGNLSGEFWLGNDDIHKLTHQTEYQLRFDLSKFNDANYFALYDSFAVSSEATNYKVTVGKYSAGDAGDAFHYTNGYSFTTKDRDNDAWGSNCAVSFKGAWWYTNCHASNLNGLYLRGSHSSYADGINWGPITHYYYSLKTTSMMIRPVDFIGN